MARKIRVASFFTGIGGFDLGCERAGMKVVFQCEINPFCQKVLQKHWPNVILWENINQLKAQDIPESDIWCGGFPCQDVSLANQGKRAGLEGDRSGLFFKFSELISERLPKWLIIENVPGLLNSNHGKDFQVLLEALDEFGYGISWRILDAKYFGTPQRRRRVFIVASLGSLLCAEVLFEPAATTIAHRQGLGAREISPARTEQFNSAPNLYAIQHAGIGRKHSAGPQAKGFRSDGEAYTLDSRGSSDAVCKTNDTFRMREVAGVSPGMDGNRYRAVGNAVAVPVVEWIARRIVEADEKWNSEGAIQLELNMNGTAGKSVKVSTEYAGVGRSLIR